MFLLNLAQLLCTIYPIQVSSKLYVELFSPWYAIVLGVCNLPPALANLGPHILLPQWLRR